MGTFMVCMLFIICNIFTLFILAITPYITRKTESFGVSIPEEKHSDPEVKALRQNYRNNSLIYGGILSLILLIVALVKPSDLTIMLLPFGTIILLVITFAFYLNGHKKMKALKASGNWLSQKTQVVILDTGFRSKKMMASPVWFMLYALIILATAGISVLLYDKMPAMLPMHWNINGEVDRFAIKSYGTILWAPFTQMFITLIMGFSYWTIGKSKQVIDPTNPETSSEQNRTFRYRWSLFIIMTGLATLIMFDFIAFSSFGFMDISWLMMPVILVITGGIVIGSTVLSITTGQGGSRLYTKSNKKDGTSENKTVSRDDDRFWKLGLFYFNPEDPSFIVEKRFGVGWTTNWARPISWIIVLGLIVATVGFVIVSILITK